jgi:hypothetical protein
MNGGTKTRFRVQTASKAKVPAGPTNRRIRRRTLHIAVIFYMIAYACPA